VDITHRLVIWWLRTGGKMEFMEPHSLLEIEFRRFDPIPSVDNHVEL
jgi:hypothetical protein